METGSKKTTRELLVEHFLKWQYESGDSKSQSQFATFIGESEKYLSQLMNGREPSKRQAISFAEFFSDPRFYDARGLDRPDPLLSYIKRNWGNVPDAIKKKIAEELSQYSREPFPNDDGINGKQ